MLKSLQLNVNAHDSYYKRKTKFCIIPPSGGQVRNLASPGNGQRAGQFPAQSYLPYVLKVLVTIKAGQPGKD